jgi:hypothetical protein
MKWRNLFCALFGIAFSALPASANWLYTPGAGPSAFLSFNAGTTPAGTALCAATNVDCLAQVPVNVAGAALFVTGNAGLVTGTGGTFPATLNATPTLANGNGVVPTIGGAVYSATNGAYFNVLQGNAVLSATNGAYFNVLQGNAALSATNGTYTNPLQGNAVLSATNGLFVAPTTAATWTVEPGNTANTTPWLFTINQGSNSAAVVTGSTTPSTSNPALVVSLSPSTNGLTPTATGQNQTLPTGWLMFGCEFSTTPATITSGNGSPLACDTANNLIVNMRPTTSSAGALSHAVSTALETAHVIKASAGNLYSFQCVDITGAAAGNCIAVNAASAPGTGTITGVIDACSFGTTTSGCSFSRIPIPVNYSTGIVILCSSAASPFTYTTGTDTCFIEADYD